MNKFRTLLFGATLATVTSVGFVQVQAATISSPSTLNLLNLGTGNGAGYSALNTAATTSAPSLGIVNITYGPSSSPTGVYSGSSPTTNGQNGYSSPFGAGSNRNYFAIEPGGTITFTYSTPQTSFALLFGTIDTYNSITFGTSAGQTFSGTDVTNAIGSSPTGSTTRNVLFSALTPFTTLTARDSDFSAFEFVPGSVAVAEPASLALLGAGLVAAGTLRRRRSRMASGRAS